MKITRVAINGGATPVSVPSNIPAKMIKIVEDSGAPSVTLLAQVLQSDMTYSAETAFPPGEPIRIVQPLGIIAPPAGYFAQGQPATSVAYAKIRTGDASTVNVRLTEYENIPPGND